METHTPGKFILYYFLIAAYEAEQVERWWAIEKGIIWRDFCVFLQDI